MMETAKARIMFIEDEARTRNFFAQKRFTCQCSAESVERETTEWALTPSGKLNFPTDKRFRDISFARTANRVRTKHGQNY
jgi:hypothetical protein